MRNKHNIWNKHNQISLAGSHRYKADEIQTEFPISSLGDQKQWSAAVEEQDPNFWTMRVNTPANAPIGQYTLLLRASKSTHFLGNFTLLFNPWCRGRWSEKERQAGISHFTKNTSELWHCLHGGRLGLTQPVLPATPALLLTALQKRCRGSKPKVSCLSTSVPSLEYSTARALSFC